VIAEPGGGASLHAASYGRETPWLATAGVGDVLAGLVAGLAGAQTSDDFFNMVEVAVWLHVEAALAFGPGLIAEDLPEMIRKVLRALET
jgi:NAD(P)H-hydrate repair Nnr-like enzyme with NAD(P)H-hydrate dehydratase domain